MSVREVVKLSRGLPNVTDILRDSMISQTYADVILCCTGGQRFSAHRLVLSAASPYLQRVLSAHGNTACLYEPITVILPDVEGNDLAAVLGFIYTGYTAVSGDRLEAFSSTAEALNIKIPPLPRPLSLSRDEISLSTGGTGKWEKYHDNVGINMTKNKLNEEECYQGVVHRMPPQCSEEELYENDCLNLEKKNCYGFREKRRPRFYVANRASASPWCQILQPHHLSKNHVAQDGNIIQTEEVESLHPENPTNHPPTDRSRLSYSSPPHHQLPPAIEVCPQTTSPSSPTAANQKIISGRPRKDVSLIGLLGEPVFSSTNISTPIETSDARPEVSHNNFDNTNQSQFTCKICDKNFESRASLKVHTRLHSLPGEKPFRCKDCGKGFSQLRNYKYHRSIHEGTGEFSTTCPECGKSFNDRSYLGSHMKIHRNRKEYSCGECGKGFNQRVAYNMHVRIHSGIKPHQCEECGKAFSRKMLLKQHFRIHSGERPYQCNICQKAFADRSNMTLHTRLHSGLKPYKCDICSKAFTKKHHLKTHLNYHAGVKPYSCPNCSLAFSQSSNMRTHFKRCSVNSQSVNNSQSGERPLRARC
ncbi:zinc finger protein 260-like [Diachasmimorpha longicaudata]|uniref:zinc finger protein 260-like n=1 Tax=Diachasmimorpha longicaudata TaxID=58733 RepID=UPI0030B917C1